MSVASPKVALVTRSGKHRVGSYIAEALAARGFALAIIAPRRPRPPK